MKALIQLVEKCTLRIGDIESAYSHIEKGLLIFIGIRTTDTKSDADKLAKKIAGLRIFHDSNGKMNLSCTDPDINGEFMVVSQFTLYGNCVHGRRPDMFDAARPEIAKPLYEYFKEVLYQEAQKITPTYNKPIASGCFGADMNISFTNTGPVTFIIESEVLK